MSTEFLNWPKVILFGDSLIEHSFDPINGRWGALLQDKLQRIADVIPRGFSGYNSRNCCMILPKIFNKENVSNTAAFLILLGANDSSGDESSQHVPLNKFKDNLAKIIDYLKNLGISKEKILLLTLPPYNKEAWDERAKALGKDYGSTVRMTMEYVEAIIDVGQKYDVEVIDLYSEMIKHENWKTLLVDGLHFSGSGSDLVFSLVWPYIEKRINTTKQFCPYWRDFDIEFKET